MTFALPEGLAPEIYPLAWLVGTWHGRGTVGYGDVVPEAAIDQQVVFDHDGGPYLTYRSEARLVDTDGVVGEVWHTESGFWRVAPPAVADDVAAGAADPGEGVELEVLLAEPTGFVSVYLGTARPARIDLATDLVARTPSAVQVDAARRMYGLVNSDLLWVWDLAAFGRPLGSYMAAQLVRQA